MSDLPQNVQLVLVAFITTIGTLFGTRLTSRAKEQELKKTEQSEFLQTILKRLSEVQDELDQVWDAMQTIKDENRSLKTEIQIKDMHINEYLRVLGRVAACECAGCPNVARAKEFFIAEVKA